MKDKNGKDIISPLDDMNDDEDWSDFDQTLLDGLDEYFGDVVDAEKSLAEPGENIHSQEFWEKLKV